MERLPITDAGWLLIEGRETPMHVGGLQLFELPEDPPRSFLQDLFERFRSSEEVQPPFGYRLDKPYGRAGTYAWVADEEIDLDYHVRHSALPKPGRVRELFVLISRLHSTLLDRHRPLWETHLIEGLRGRRFAVYTKFHHSLFDGVGAMRMAQRMLSTDPDASSVAPWELPPGTTPGSGDEGPGLLGSVAAALGQGIGQVSSVAGVGKALAGQFAAKARGVTAEAIPYQAPRSVLNGRITGSRRFAADGYEFERMRSVAKALDATVNDVALAMCSSALRAYLDDLGALPDKPLVAMVPVSIREDDSSRGNAISFLLANLATDLVDPQQRLEQIKASMQRGKDRLKDMSVEERINYALVLVAPTIFGNLLGTAGRVRPSHNVVISNVPGPRQPLYFNGARMQGMYPVSLLPNGQALNITLTSYGDDMEFGIIACRKTLPHVQRLLDHLESGLKELENLAA